MSVAVEEALAYWYGLINYEHRTPLAADLKLGRMRDLLAALGNPHARDRIVHVAGSKGKGSTAAMLAGIFQAAGYRTGLFTSPHLVRMEERFQVDGQPIDLEKLAAFLLEVRAAATRKNLPDLTFFEVATAVAFLHFARSGVEATVLEVGLGGRFDSTNVCDPAVALITSISHDHTQLLGKHLTSIAFEKAGILKPDRPAVSGCSDPDPRGVIERVARERHCPLRQLGIDFRYEYRPGQVTEAGLEKARVRVVTERRSWPEFDLNLLGEHQAANAAVALAAVEELIDQGWRIPDEAVRSGLAHVSWPARLEVVGRRPLVVLDCAHNVASVLALVETLRSSFPPGRRLLVFAASNDKDVPAMMQALAPNFEQVFLTGFISNPRAVPPTELETLLRGVSSLPATVHGHPSAALEAAPARAGATGLVCITGSVFLAGELRPLLTTGP